MYIYFFNTNLVTSNKILLLLLDRSLFFILELLVRMCTFVNLSNLEKYFFPFNKANYMRIFGFCFFEMYKPQPEMERSITFWCWCTSSEATDWTHFFPLTLWWSIFMHKKYIFLACACVLTSTSELQKMPLYIFLSGVLWTHTAPPLFQLPRRLTWLSLAHSVTLLKSHWMDERCMMMIRSMHARESKYTTKKLFSWDRKKESPEHINKFPLQRTLTKNEEEKNKEKMWKEQGKNYFLLMCPLTTFCYVFFVSWCD